jgi:hypothetical protein
LVLGYGKTAVFLLKMGRSSHILRPTHIYNQPTQISVKENSFKVLKYLTDVHEASYKHFELLSNPRAPLCNFKQTVLTTWWMRELVQREVS